MEIKIINKSTNDNPAYVTSGSAGMDIRSNVDLTIPGQSRAVVPTGIYVEIPVGYEIQVRPRSGLAVKHGITVLNSPGTIDSDYRGELLVILYNTTNQPFKVTVGDRIAQLVLAKYERIDWTAASQLSETVRADGGIGHSGIK